MTNTIRLTGRMADALVNTVRTEDGQTIRLALNVHQNTVIALMDLGLVQHSPELSQQNGYPVHTFTPMGLAARKQLNGSTYPQSVRLEAASEPVQDKLTDGMRQALLSTYTVGDHREFPTSTPGSTLRALVRRGLAKEPNPLENMGYALTLAGSAARHTLIKESEEPKTCGNVLRSARRLDGGTDEICVREAGHRGRRHRNNASVTAPGTVVWEDAEPNHAGSVVEHKAGFHVKLWYMSGSMERIPGLEFMTAASLYGEGEDNPRVCAGEVHDSRGMLVASFERCVDSPGNRG